MQGKKKGHIMKGREFGKKQKVTIGGKNTKV